MKGRVGPILWLVFTVVSVVGQGSGAENVSERINRLISKAVVMGDTVRAEAMIDEAQGILIAEGMELGELERMFLKPDLMRARGGIYSRRLKNSKKNEELRKQSRRLLLDSIEQYERLYDRADESAKEFGKRFTLDQLMRNKKWKNMRGYQSRANYSKAWSLYALAGVADSDNERQGSLVDAIDIFSGFTAGGFKTNPIVADCFLGMAMCHHEQGQYYAAARLVGFDVMGPDNTTATFFKRLSSFRIKNYLKMRSAIDAECAAKLYFDRLPAGHRLDGGELYMAIERVRSLAHLCVEVDHNPYYKSFRRRLGAVAGEVYSYGGSSSAAVAKILADNGIESAPSNVKQARDHLKEERWEAALDEAKKGLRLVEEFGDGDVGGDLEYIAFAAEVELERYRAGYDRAVRFMKQSVSNSRAERMCSGAIEAGLKAVRQGELSAESLDEFLDIVEARFGDSEAGRKLLWYRASVRLEVGDHDGAIAILENVSKASGKDVYLYGLYGRAIALYRKAKETADDAAAGRFLNEATGHVREFIRAAGGSGGAKETVCASMGQAGLAILREMLDQQGGDYSQVRAFAAELAELSCAGEGYPETLLAFSIEADVMGGDLDAAKKRMDAVFARRLGGKAVSEAMLKAAGMMEARYQSLMEDGSQAGRSQAEALGNRLVRIYSFLIDNVPRTERGAEQKMQLERRLAWVFLQSGKFKLAVRLYENVVEGTDKQTGGEVIYEFAEALEGAGEYEKAIVQWQMLARGLTRQSEKWLMANYRFINCYYLSGNNEQAKKQKDYFMVKYRHGLSDEWRKQFESLGEVER